MAWVLLSKEVEVTWAASNIKWYRAMGYIFTRYQDVVVVKVTDLMPKSHAEVQVQCDYCGALFTKKWNKYQLGREIVSKDCCNNAYCMNVKRQESNQIRYGVSFPMHIEGVPDKVAQTNIERYGCANVLANQEIRERIKSTCLTKYGVENPFGNEEIKDKIKTYYQTAFGVDNAMQVEKYKIKASSTCLQRYGGSNPLRIERFKEKAKETHLRRYGVEHYNKSEEAKNRAVRRLASLAEEELSLKYKLMLEKTNATSIARYGVKWPMQHPDIQRSFWESLSRKGSVNTSKAQAHIHKLLGGELNYFVDKYFLDIAFPTEMIYIEYDGGGHNLSVKFGIMTEKEFQRRERNRYFYLKRLGWKLVRIISPCDYLPASDILLADVNNALTLLKGSDKFVYTIEMGRSLNDPNYGRLVQIKNEVNRESGEDQKENLP